MKCLPGRWWLRRTWDAGPASEEWMEILHQSSVESHESMLAPHDLKYLFDRSLKIGGHRDFLKPDADDNNFVPVMSKVRIFHQYSYLDPGMREEYTELIRWTISSCCHSSLDDDDVKTPAEAGGARLQLRTLTKGCLHSPLPWQSTTHTYTHDTIQ